MSIRPGLLPSLLRPLRSSAPRAARSFHFMPSGPSSSATSWAARARSRVVEARAMTRAAPRQAQRGSMFLLSLGLGVAGLAMIPRTVHCAAAQPATLPQGAVPAYSAPPPDRGATTVSDAEAKSILSVGELSFGAAVGLCAGVFVKKGFKLVAFALGGVFVLLQYLSSKSYVTVDWGRVANSYNGAVGTVDQKGNVVMPTFTGAINGLVDFLTANFQQRATFVAGFILGLRLG